MTTVMPSRRNSRRSSISSDCSNSNSIAAKPRNSNIQKVSTNFNSYSNSGSMHRSKSTTYIDERSSQQQYLRGISGPTKLIASSKFWKGSEVLEQLNAQISEEKATAKSKSKEMNSKLIGNRSIKEVFASIVRGSSKIKNRSASMETNGLINKIADESGLRISESRRSILEERSLSCIEQLPSSGNNKLDNNKLVILTGPPTQRSILTRLDLSELKAKVDFVLSTEQRFLESAKYSFQQFDSDNDGYLKIDELLDLLTTLGEHLALPPINKKSVVNEILTHLNSTAAVDLKNPNELETISFHFFLRYFLNVLTAIRRRHFDIKKFQQCSKQNSVSRKHLVYEEDINDLYTFHNQLGIGTYGEVYLVTENYTRQRRVCKIIDKVKCKKKLDNIDLEIEILKRLDHPGIVHIYEVYEDKLNMYIIQEYCAGGNLFQSLRDSIQSGFRISEYHVARIVQQILLAVRYLHQQRVVHKDLKPQNILLTNSFGSGNTTIKLIDFGLSEMFTSEEAELLLFEDTCTKIAGSLDYMAPEMILGQPFSYSVDIWAVGVVMFCLLTGYHPFKGSNHSETKANICESIAPIDEIPFITELGKNLLKRLLEKKPRCRITVDEALNHEWLVLPHKRYNEVDIGAPLLAHLRAYTRQSELRHLLIHMLTHQLALDTTQINMITSIFRFLDTDNDGLLSLEEIANGFESAGILQWEAAIIMRAMDIDGNGMISYSEFITACHIWKKNEIRQLRSLFMKIDLDRDGIVSRHDFKTLLKTQQSKLLSNITKGFSSFAEPNCRTVLPSTNQGVYTDWDTILDEIDTNHDGSIDWSEFCEFILSFFNDSKRYVKSSNTASVVFRKEPIPQRLD
ncbi:protein kinase domain-containing protein [Cryptosporidium serpentis]